MSTNRAAEQEVKCSIVACYSNVSHCWWKFHAI